jgi:Ca2+-binding RTX toxin-like protein
MSTIDTSATSSKRYRLYEVWIENPGQAVVINECNASTASSCDSPENWADTPAAVELGSGTNSYPAVAAAPNGDVYVAWWDQDADQIMIDRCLASENCNLDASWNEATVIDNDLDPGSASPLPFFCPIIAAPGGRVGPQTYVDVGPDGRVYVAYSELRNNGSSRCSASATDRTFESRIAAGAANTFPALNSGVRISDDTATALNDHFFATLAADPSMAGGVESSLYSTKLDSTGQTTNQFYVTSADGGASYSAMTQISTAVSNFSGANSDGFDYGDYAGADAAGGLFFPSWTDNRAAHGGDAELYMLTPDVVPPPPPAAPTLNDTDPNSPANDNQPEVKGIAEAGSTVDIYTNALCTGTLVATGTAAQLLSPGITVTVADNSTTTFFATATNTGGTSSCSAGLTYIEVTPPPSTGPAPPTPPTTGPAAVVATCKGKAATIVGTNGNDVLSGTPGQDVIAGLGGNDKLSGLAGKDLICGGAGKDKLRGGAGKDTLLGQKGKDTLTGGGAKDVCKGGKGKDSATCEVEKSI